MNYYNCEYCKKRISESEDPSSHAYSCPKQPKVECQGCKNKVPVLVMKFQGCQTCDSLQYAHSQEIQFPYCPMCGKKTAELSSSDDDWDEMRCKDECPYTWKVRSQYWMQEMNDPTLGMEPPEATDPDAASEAYRRQIEGI